MKNVIQFLRLKIQKSRESLEKIKEKDVFVKDALAMLRDDSDI